MISCFKDNYVLWAIAVLLLFGCSFWLRWSYWQNTSFDSVIRADAARYFNIAYNFSEYGVVSSEFYSAKDNPVDTAEKWPIGYPLFLLAVMEAGGHGPQGRTPSLRGFVNDLMFVQALLGAATVVLTLVFASFLLPFAYSVAAAALVMISPHMLVLSSYMLTEALFTFLLMGSLVGGFMAWKRNGWCSWIVAGVLCGLAVLVRPVLMAFPPLLVVLSVYHFYKRDLKNPYHKYAVYLLLALALNLGWSFYNSGKFGEQSLAGRGLKEQLLVGSYPDFIYKDPRFKMEPFREDSTYYDLLEADYPEILAYLGGKFRREPARHLGWYLRKPVFFWTWNIYGGLTDPRYGVDIYHVTTSWFDKNIIAGWLRVVMVKLQPLFAWLALVGIFLVTARKLFQKNTFFMVPVALLALYTMMFVFLASIPRYSLPLGPALYTMAMVVPWQVAMFFRKNKDGCLKKSPADDA